MSEAGVAAAMSALYRNRFAGLGEGYRTRMWRTLVDAFFQRYVGPDETILDLGAGRCEFINQVKAARKIAIDQDESLTRFAASEVETVCAPLRRLADVVPEHSVDVAMASNLFEHLESPEALLDVLQQVFSRLRPGGRLLVLQPNIRFTGPAFWDYLDHRLPLTERGMAEALDATGFIVRELRPRFLPYTVKSRLPAWPILIRAYLRVPLVQRWLGAQMWIVAERP